MSGVPLLNLPLPPPTSFRTLASAPQCDQIRAHDDKVLIGGGEMEMSPAIKGVQPEGLRISRPWHYWITFLLRGGVMHYGVFSSKPGLYPLDSSCTPIHTPGVTTKPICRLCRMSPGRKSYLPLPLRGTKLEQSQSSLVRKGDAGTPGWFSW